VRPFLDHCPIAELGLSFAIGYTSGGAVAFGMLADAMLLCRSAFWRWPVLSAAAASSCKALCQRRGRGLWVKQCLFHGLHPQRKADPPRAHHTVELNRYPSAQLLYAESHRPMNCTGPLRRIVTAGLPRTT
jgi:hypothetical protein